MILISWGTRPEWLKVKPIIEELKRNRINFATLFTGQHEDIVDCDISPDYKINIGKSDFIDRLTRVHVDVMNATGSILYNAPEIKFVMVQGDTTSAVAVAMAAYNAKRYVIHLEAGLRTHDLKNPFPEEANRQIISRFADIHLCPTIQNQSNLEQEWVGGIKVVCGNTALDNLLPYLSQCEYENKILITLHRRENHDKIKEWFNTLNVIASNHPDHEWILPIHPNPNVKKYANLLTNIKVVDPLSHDDLLNILVKCKFVITDSGGIQEECSFLGKKAIVCRKETERPEALGHTTELCETPQELIQMVGEYMEKYEVINNRPSPFGDGHSGKKIVKFLKNILSE